MRGSFVRGWPLRIAILLASCALSAVWVPRAVAPSAPILASFNRPSDLPSALQVSLSHQDVTLVSAVAADIDADGDLDVVGSDDHLALVVLVNDGHGHLTPRTAPRSTTWRPEPGEPTLHDHARAANASVQNEPTPLGLELAPAFALPIPAAFAPRLRQRPPDAALVSTRVPRAPPDALRG